MSKCRDTAVTLSAGFRSLWNIGDRQLVIDLAVPVTRSVLRRAPRVLGPVPLTQVTR